MAAAVARLAPGGGRPPRGPHGQRRADGRQWPQRILLLRLERIGDLLMSAPAIAAVRQFAPDAEIDLVVGSWNASIARLIPGLDRVETLDASWLSRGSGGGGMRALMAQARGWRARHYDLAINFEGDIRSHLLVALSGATGARRLHDGRRRPAADPPLRIRPASAHRPAPGARTRRAERAFARTRRAESVSMNCSRSIRLIRKNFPPLKQMPGRSRAGVRGSLPRHSDCSCLRSRASGRWRWSGASRG